jgi:hypothetical protein
MKTNERITELERITVLAIKSVKQYRKADSENDKWRDRHAHWPELEKIITDKEHLEVEALYNNAGDTMDEAVKAFRNYKKGIVAAAIPPLAKAKGYPCRTIL